MNAPVFHGQVFIMLDHHFNLRFGNESIERLEGALTHVSIQLSRDMIDTNGSTQTELYKHRSWLETGTFGFRNKNNRTIHAAKKRH